MVLASQASDALSEKICETSNIYENEQADESHCSYREDHVQERNSQDSHIIDMDMK